MTKSMHLPMLLLLAVLLTACGETPAATLPVIPTATPAPPTQAATALADQPSPTAGGTDTVVPATSTAPPTAVPATSTAPPTAVPATSSTPPSTYTGKIVFESLDGQIFLINPDSTGRKKLAAGRSPQFAPDGTRVAILAVLSVSSDANPFGLSAIRALKLDGSGSSDYCTSDANAHLSLLRWSPSGRFIVLNGTQNGPGTVFLCDTTSRELGAQLQTRQGNASLVYDWTPDGAQALWQAGTQYTDLDLYYGDPQQGGVGAVRLTNGQNRLVLDGFSYYAGARFSPDGKTIAIAGSQVFFVSVPGESSPLDGKVIGAFNSPGSLSWSPDGRALAITDRTNRLSVVDLASGSISTLAENVATADWSRR